MMNGGTRWPKRETKQPPGPTDTASPTHRPPSDGGYSEASNGGGVPAPSENVVVPVDALRKTRSPVHPPPNLEPPRVPTWSDQVNAIRVMLIASSRGDQLASSRGDQLKQQLGLLTGSIYRYSRQSGLTNDEMGYGERVTEQLRTGRTGATAEERAHQPTNQVRQTVAQPTDDKENLKPGAIIAAIFSGRTMPCSRIQVSLSAMRIRSAV